MISLYLIRHTTLQIKPGICYGQSNIPLASSFPEELDTLQKKLPSFDAVYTSPLDRCLHLAKQLSPSPQTDKRLMELNFGDWESQSWDSIDDKRLSQWMENYVDTRCPNGESYEDLFQRTQDFLSSLAASPNPETQTIAIISHGGPIRALLAGLLDLPLKKMFRFSIDYGSVSIIKADFKTPHHNQLKSLNL